MNWTETNDEDKIDYYDDRKHGIIQVYCRIRLPYKFYEVANALSILYNLRSFDDYVSELVYEDVEHQVQMNPEMIGDCMVNKITGEQTHWHTAEEVTSSPNSDSKDTTTIEDTTETYPDLGLPSREEVEKKWGKIPDDD